MTRSRAIPARFCIAAELSGTADGLLGAAPGQTEHGAAAGGDRQVCNDRGAATGAVGSGRLEYDAVAGHFRQLAGRIAAQLVMQLLAASIWLATQPVDKAGDKVLQS